MLVFRTIGHMKRLYSSDNEIQYNATLTYTLIWSQMLRNRRGHDEQSIHADRAGVFHLLSCSSLVVITRREGSHREQQRQICKM